MTINIQNASNVNVIGRNSDKHCKAVYNITTGEIYASGLDAANALGVDPASVSCVLNGKYKTCKGMRLCFVSRMMEHLEEITEQNRIRSAKVAAYDADIGRRKVIANAEEDVRQRQAKVEELRKQLEEAQADLYFAEYDLSELKNGGN